MEVGPALIYSNRTLGRGDVLGGWGGPGPVLPGNASNETGEQISEEERAFRDTVVVVRNVFVPVNALVGLTGNSLSLAVFTNSHLRHVSSSSYLAALACADNLFLICVVLSWVNDQANFIVTAAACSAFAYLQYVSTFLSVWYVVCFTAERYIALCHSLHAPMIFAKLRERRVVALLAVFALLLYNFSLWMTTSGRNSHVYVCHVIDDYIHFLKVFTYVDTVLTMLLPFLLILFMNLAIVRRVCRSQRKWNSYLQEHKSDAQGGMRATANRETGVQVRITRTLLLVSTTFLVLNLPSHVMRIIQMFGSNSKYQPLYMRMIQEVSHLVFYLTFSVNFFLYSLYGKHFKKSLYVLFRHRCCGKKRSDRFGRNNSESFRMSSMTTRVPSHV